jgi:hypothetical protein
MNRENKYNSIFVPEIKIDLPNFLTELLIKNYLEFNKKPLPSSPFWRKDISNQSSDLQELSKRYALELIGIKQLLKVFSPESISKLLTEKRYFAFKHLKKESQARFLYELFQIEIKLDHSRCSITEQVKNTQFTGKMMTSQKTLLDI